MNISELSVRRPVLVSMIYVLVCVVSCIFLPKLSVALYPSVSNPVISVSVSCSDAGPEEIEMQVAKVLENQLGSIEGLEKIATTSSSGSCRATLTFSYKTDLDDASTAVSSKLSSISRNLPDWAGTPSMMRFDLNNNSAVVDLLITGPYSQEDLKTIADSTVSNLLLRIPGVGEVSVYGRDNVSYAVRVDPVRLASLGLTMNQVSSALNAANKQGTAGNIDVGNMRFTVSIDERYKELSEIAETVIIVRDGIPVKVSDIANVTVSSDNTDSNISYLNGEPIVSISVSNESDANQSKVAADVIAALDSINAELPSGVKVTLNRDRTAMISSTMSQVYDSAFAGVVLAALVIFIFLRGIKTTVIISLSMPVSILVTLMVMAIAEISVNSMSMSGLILGIGMIVDASICILENSYAYREQGFKPAVAAILGSRRMFNAIFASTATTVCVFLPVLIYRTDLGQIGMMFKDLVLTICISIISSLFVAVTLVPALFGSVFSVDSRVQKPFRNPVVKTIDKAMTGIENSMRHVYGSVLDYCLSHRLLIVLVCYAALVFSLGFVGRIGLSLAPSSSSDDSVSVSLTLPAGTLRTETRKELFRLESSIEKNLPHEAYESISVRTNGINTGSLVINLPSIDEQKYSASDVRKAITPYLNDNPAAVWTVGSGRSMGSGNIIDVEIHSSDSSTAKEAADSIASIIGSFVPDARNVTSDIAGGAPKITVHVDRAAASALGITNSTILSNVQYALSGIEATNLNTFSNTSTYDLEVRFPSDSFDSIDELGSILIPSSNGNVMLDSIASFEMGTSAKSIKRENKVRVNHVTASAAEGVSASELQKQVNDALSVHLLLPDGVTIKQKGEMQQFGQYAPTLVAVIVIALVLVYAVMAAQFESMTDPFIIFLTIPTMMIGVVFIHIIMGQDLSLYSIVGIVALIGVVVNNGIVLVDAINYELSRRVPLREACVKSAERRLRPILMTTLTTVIGMVPMAFFPGSGAQTMQPVALTFFGGMVTAAIMTLVLVPVLYSIFNKKKERFVSDPMSLFCQLEEYDSGVLDLKDV